ncbi:MAG: hypothetical protein KAH01_06135 [Caldisericia bacterium]|nr:hypothetical protein [Caldisericia bacterium]
MSFSDWMNKKVKKMNWVDIACVKIAVMFFTLMIVAIWQNLATIEWYWYLIPFVIFSIVPLKTAYCKNK